MPVSQFTDFIQYIINNYDQIEKYNKDNHQLSNIQAKNVVDREEINEQDFEEFQNENNIPQE